MSTPADPQNSNAEASNSDFRSGTPLGHSVDHTSEGNRTLDDSIDRTVAPAGTSKWSDADVLDRSGDHHTTMLPPVHVTQERKPEVHIRDTAPTVEQPVVQAPVHQEPEVRAQPVAVPAPPDRQTVVAREKERFGGMKFGSAFFGWLTATGLAVLLLAILAAAGVAFGVATANNVDNAVHQSASATGTAKTVGLVGAIVLLVILFVAYYCGGYVAGRMARFDGVKQGLGVWIWAIITSAVIAGVAAVAGAKYNVLAQLNLPRIPVDEGSVTTVGIIAIVAAILVTLLGALLGGAVGTRYHRKVDAVGFEDVTVTR